MSSSPSDSVVLLVDSEAESLAQLRSILEDSGHTLIEATDVAEALSLVEKHRPGLVISELGLPDGSGFSLCRQLRESGATVRLMMVSRWAREADRILAFECGADEFLAKPFFARELASRVRALLRRGADTAPQARVRSADPPPAPESILSIDPNLRTIKLSGRRLPLTPREFTLLRTLIEGRGRVFSRHELVGRETSEENAPGVRSVDAHIKSIRQKLGSMGHAVETIRGAGYRYSGTDPNERSLN